MSRPDADAALVAAATARLASASGTGPAAAVAETVVVVADVVPPAFALGAVEFTLGLPEDLGRAWHRSFTRTLFLAGQPGTVVSRHPARHVAADASMSWHGPAQGDGLRDLSRLLRAFRGPRPAASVTRDLSVLVPGGPAGHVVEARMATAGVGVGDYLVHLHHLLGEATLRGLIRRGDTVRIGHAPHLDDPDSRAALEPGRADVVQTRITHDHADPGRLRLYGVLVSERRRS
ncbi:DUF6182 family protein [Mangrovihabitans endophyticus]|uniref:Uncharacterized protein n=1 Tax=Mangrovihabitans endophyticus TaxID=1751298 RepID=A0A8J3C918_9ACTN|nr:DUF6182 family protein [Mangrovihabitans endophyticus]GGL19841.1 hypothetical protein GCM10012284_63060 [Mangrovihabitans endophyticus]